MCPHFVCVCVCPFDGGNTSHTSTNQFHGVRCLQNGELDEKGDHVVYSVKTDPAADSTGKNILEELDMDVRLPFDPLFRTSVKVSVYDGVDNSLAGVGYRRLQLRGCEDVHPDEVARQLDLIPTDVRSSAFLSLHLCV